LIPNDEPLRPWLGMKLETVDGWRIDTGIGVVQGMEDNVFQWRKVL